MTSDNAAYLAYFASSSSSKAKVSLTRNAIYLFDEKNEAILTYLAWIPTSTSSKRNYVALMLDPTEFDEKNDAASQFSYLAYFESEQRKHGLVDAKF